MKAFSPALIALLATLCASLPGLGHDLGSGVEHPREEAAVAAPAFFTESAPPAPAPPAGNGALMAASFAPFRPKVRHSWDGTYFYEESDGIPDRTRMPNLMVGITSWQQQVPLPLSYFASTTNSTNDTGSLGYQQPNYWKLPLVPVPSASPIPISSGNFQRGAIALAADGVPIFNPANNTGRISYEIGELDAYGGHCGLGDDYHYHIAPVHLIPILGADKPIAWALDGYPMYGYVEPDGTAMQSLDSDGGHDHGVWGYHYHARGTFSSGQWTPSAPYMNAAFHGTVVNYGGQVDPQPSGSGLRGSGTGGYTAQPVTGASITAFKNPVALTTDGSGHFIENAVGTPSNDDWLMRISISGTSYDICWRLNRTANPRTMTITWRLPGATTTTTYNNTGNRITPYSMAAASMIKLPDTSQTLDTTSTFGEDADYSINAQSFTDHGNGTTTDNITGLMWQKVDNGESTWETATSNATAVSTGGYNDWRLPTPGELFSILNHNNGNPAAIDTTYFPSNPNGTAGYWWTSDFYGNSTTNVWCANAGGGLGPKPKTETISAGGTLRYHARYVRGAKPTNGHNYLNNGDGTVTDLDTSLMWSQVPGSAVTWDGALTYAENLTLAGYLDWRLPNVKELQTLTDYALTAATSTTGIKPSINRTLFPAATATAYWSSTTVKGATPTEAWLLEAGINSTSNPPRNSQGIISYELKTATYPVFAVRTTSVATQIAVSESGNSLTDGASTVSYGNVNVGATASKTFTITNNGSTSLAITGVTIDGSNAGSFTVTTMPAGSIAAGASTTMVVQFSAVSLGSKLASLHIASSDALVGAAFDINLGGVGYIPPPAITAIRTTPTVPSDTDTPFVTAQVTPATGATISQVQLTYGTGAQTTITPFAETMATTATGGTGGWDGTGANYPWTLTSTAGAGNIKQTTAANHGTGNPCGLEFGKGSSSATATMAATTTAINASGTTGYVEFWSATSNLTAGLGWTFQLSTDGTTWTTRLSELAGRIHPHQLSHYDLPASERVSTLRMRFQFIGNGVGGPTAPKAQIDDITVVSTTGAAPLTVTMFDDGLHGDGAAGDGVYGVQLPAQPSGTTVSCSITATDNSSASTTIASAGNYTTGPAPGITTTSLPNATTGGAYSQTLAGSGGAPGYTWSVGAGALPTGLTLSSAGVLSGTAATAGTFSFTITITDSEGRIGARAFTLTVSTATAPNVVIILTDDQGWADIGYHTASGQVAVQTPNMARIGTEGIRLEKFYATPVCAVTRSCLLTGRNTLRTNAGNQRGLGLTEHLLPQTFKAAGYQTYMCGKWHIGGPANNLNTATLNGSTFSVTQEGAEYLPHNRGWDLHYGQYGGAINYFSHTSVDPGIAGSLDWWLNGTPVVETTDAEGNGGYSTDLLADKAVAQIINRDKTRPMLLYLAFNGVHAGVQVPQSYIDKYAGLGVTDTKRRTLCAAVDCMDVAMGRVLNALDSEGITSNTVVLFMSDNGGDTTTGSINSPLRGTKNDSYDGGIHTPAAIRWPGVLPAGVTSNQYVWVGDIFPTLCSATGITPLNTKPFDGLNLWPALLAASNTSAVIRPVPLVTATSTPVAYDTFTDPVNGGSKVFKLIRTKVGSTFTNELFNMTDDPYEATDLLLGGSAASYAAIVTSLTTAITSIIVESYPPYIGDVSKPSSVAQGGSVTLYAPFTSYKTPTVQWRKNGVGLSGATVFGSVTNSGIAVNGVYLATLTLTNVNATHAASYDAVITNVAGTTTSQAGPLIVTRPFSTQNDGVPDSWKTAHGIDPNSTATINGPLGDIDHDGSSNFLEYAFNTDPRANDSAPWTTLIRTNQADGKSYLEFSYLRRVAIVDLLYLPEVSENLSTWSSSPANFEAVSTTANSDGVTETVHLRVLPALETGVGAAPRKFIHLKVTAQ